MTLVEVVEMVVEVVVEVVEVVMGVDFCVCFGLSLGGALVVTTGFLDWIVFLVLTSTTVGNSATGVLKVGSRVTK